jgi:hypothetical protein
VTEDTRDSDVDRQITALTEIIDALATTVSQLSDRVTHLDNTTRSRGHGATGEGHEPAAWVWLNPPAAAEDDSETTDPRVTVERFVTWYNITYVGVEGSRARPIPDCWRDHPGLAMEIATLAHNWRAANIGPSASPREAQYWHHQWRPGLTDRLTREWVHTDCLDGEHRATGATERADRFTLAEREPSGHEDTERT